MLSRPIRARGLKHKGVGKHINKAQSRPIRARGLKHPGSLADYLGFRRAPYGRVD